MKTLAIILTLFVASALGTQTSVPQAVTKAFEIKYRGAEKLSWSEEDNLFTAAFEHDDLSKEAIFRKDGSWTQTITTLNINELDECITDFIENEYEDTEIMGAELLEKPDINLYHISIEITTTEENEEGETITSTENDLLIFNEDCESMGEGDK